MVASSGPGRSSPEPWLVVNGRGTVVTVGTFDGLHRGHAAVLAEIRRRAQASGRRAVLVTFDPHPLKVVRPEAAPPLLCTAEEKLELLALSSIDIAVVLRFDRALKQLSPEAFVREILLTRLAMAELVIGYDHGFGRDRRGDVALLRELGARWGFAVDVVPPVLVDGAPVSSSRVRNALREGRVEEAARCLGRPYSVRGVVVRGFGRGRQLGFPTANLRVEHPDKLVPAPGIYAVHGAFDGCRRPGVLHLGPRPAFADAPPSIELHLFDYDGDLYGRTLIIEFCARLREVCSFASLDALVVQMHRDVAAARAALRQPCGLAHDSLILTDASAGSETPAANRERHDPE